MTLRRIGVLTSGGDAPGMNAAVRAVTRTALCQGLEVFAIFEGYQGMVEGGNCIRPLVWSSVGSILQRGGTIIGTARSEVFRTREGRTRAALNLVQHGIDGLVVIGGDGSLTGANILRQEWPDLLADLVSRGELAQAVADDYPCMKIVGLVGTIDNDMIGTDMTIGADTALHRIVQAIDDISSTADSHQRTFVVEVMGRHCGYLALMSGLAAGANWVLIPESPPNVDDWEDKMCQVLRSGREAGRRQSLVVVAEGAQDRYGNPIGSEYVRQVLQEKLGEDARSTILGHVQRGGSPTAFDRNLSTMLGHAAVLELLEATSDSQPVLLGMRNNRITRSPLMECVQQTIAVTEAIANKDFEEAMTQRGAGFRDAFSTLRVLVRALPHSHEPSPDQLRIAVLNAGSAAPGMNTAVRAAVRLALDRGHTLVGVRNGFRGLIDSDLIDLEWMSVNGWAGLGGSELGTSSRIPGGADFYAIARNIERHQLQALLIIGGWPAYQAAYELWREREHFPTFNLPIICMPATIDNNLPGTELSIGADTALNNIVQAVDKIKQSAGANQRCFVVEVMGHLCGYLAMMSAFATGAERVHIPELGVTLSDLQEDLEYLVDGFRHQGRRLGLVIRSELANPVYDTRFMVSLFEEEGGDLFEVRQSILGHLQQGGNPSPFDRILATRLANKCIEHLSQHVDEQPAIAAFVGLQGGKFEFHHLEDMPRLMDWPNARPRYQWWLELRTILEQLSQPAREEVESDQ